MVENLQRDASHDGASIDALLIRGKLRGREQFVGDVVSFRAAESGRWLGAGLGSKPSITDGIFPNYDSHASGPRRTCGGPTHLQRAKAMGSAISTALWTKSIY